MIRSQLMVLMLALSLIPAAGTACRDKVVELGIDAPLDGPPSGVDAATCRCRISPCRTDLECTLTGGTCGADLFCVGDFGPCSEDAQCQAQVPQSMCVKATNSTLGC